MQNIYKFTGDQITFYLDMREVVFLSAAEGEGVVALLKSGHRITFDYRTAETMLKCYEQWASHLGHKEG